MAYEVGAGGRPDGGNGRDETEGLYAAVCVGAGGGALMIASRGIYVEKQERNVRTMCWTAKVQTCMPRSQSARSDRVAFGVLGTRCLVDRGRPSLSVDRREETGAGSVD